MARPGYPRVVWEVFWGAVGRGSSVEEAAAVAGVSRPTAYRQFRALGGVRPVMMTVPGQDSAGATYRRISALEREEIALARAEGLGVRQIAQRLGRAPSTISRELRRNQSPSDGRYRPRAAHQRAEKRAREAGLAASPAKLATSLRLRSEVQSRLQENQSPEQICGKLRKMYPDEPGMWVSHETIYQSLYIQSRGGLKRELTKHLRTGRSLRQPRAQAQARRSQQTRIKDMINISERPPEVEDRAIPGHWEGDLITGTQNKTAIGTLVERTTGFVVLLHLPNDHGAAAVQHALTHALNGLPELLHKSLTWDQGIEMANHASVTTATGIVIYFCDPHSPWQRGSNENTNGLLRQYFPKSTDLSIHGPGILEHVALELNNRPRKRLDWDTPAEALNKLLSKHQNHHGVADAS